MAEINSPFIAQEFVSDQEKYGATNLDTVRNIVKNGVLSSEDCQKLPAAYCDGFNSAFRRCFPKDAFHNLRALTIVAKYIPPREDLDLNVMWKEICLNLNVATPATVTTEVAWKNFRQVQAKDFPDDKYITTTNELTEYIAETVRRAHAQKNGALLKAVLPAFKVLGYLHKMKEQTHYDCETEFDDMVSFGVDEKNLDFKYQTKDEALQAGEKFFEQARSMT